MVHCHRGKGCKRINMKRGNVGIVVWGAPSALGQSPRFWVWTFSKIEALQWVNCDGWQGRWDVGTKKAQKGTMWPQSGPRVTIEAWGEEKVGSDLENHLPDLHHHLLISASVRIIWRCFGFGKGQWLGHVRDAQGVAINAWIVGRLQHRRSFYWLQLSPFFVAWLHQIQFQPTAWKDADCSTRDQGIKHNVPPSLQIVIDSDSVAAIHNVAMELSEEPNSCCYILLLWRLKAPAADINVTPL